MITNGRVQLYPFMRIVAMLIVGIVLGDAFGGTIAIVVFGVATAVLAAASMFLWKKPICQTCVLLLAVTTLGACYTAFFVQRREVVFDGMPRLYNVVAVQRPAVRERTVSVEAVVADGEWAGRKVMVSLQRGTDADGWCADSVRVGDGLELCTIMKPFSTQYGQAGQFHFSYTRWMQAHGFVGRAFVRVGQWRPVLLGLGGLTFMQRLRLNALRWREKLLGVLARCGMKDRSRQIVAAMTLGDKSELDSNVKDSFSVSGASHLLALSGMHLGIIYLVLSALLVRYPWKSVVGQALSVAAIWMYVLVAGMPPGLVRAGVVISVYAALAIMGRHRQPLNALAMTAAAMLVANPLCLWDVGFQMSFMAVLAILVFFRPVYRVISGKWLDSHRFAKWAWSLTIVSVSAQMGVAPLVLYYFGRFSCYFLLTNFVAVPLAAIIMYLTLVLLLTSFIPWFPHVLGVVLSWLAGVFHDVVGGLASLPGASVENVHFGWASVVLMYVIWGCLYMVSKYLWMVYCFVHERRGDAR